MADVVIEEPPVEVVPEPQPRDEGGELVPTPEPSVDSADSEEPAPRYDQLVQKSVDAHEASVGWTCQQGAAPSEPDPVPGTVVTVAELPDKDSLVAAGVDLDQFFSGLVVAADDAEREVIRGVK